MDTLPQFLIAGLKDGAIYALVALGFTIAFAATGAINFAQGEFFMLGGMFGWWLVRLGLPLPIAVLLSVLITASVGAGLELLTVRPIADGDPLRIIMVTIGGSVLLRQFALHAFGADEQTIPPFSAGASVKLGGAAIELQTLWIWGITAATVIALAVLYRSTLLGKAMRATSI